MNGEIVFDDSDPISYGGSGQRHARHPWKVTGMWSQTSHRTYAAAAHELASRRAATDRKVRELWEKYVQARDAVYQRELDVLIAARPVNDDPMLGYVEIYPGHFKCGFCFRVTPEEGHEDMQTAIYHGCNK